MISPYSFTGTSFDVNTAITPGACSFLLVSMRRMRACGRRANNTFMCTMLGRTRSPGYSAVPVTFATASVRVMFWPIVFIRLPLACLLNRLDDVEVSGAPAQIAADTLLDLIASGVGVLFE